MMVDATQIMDEIARARRIGYTRHLGACPACGTGIACEDGARTATCEGCGASVVLKAVRGVYSDKTPCDDRCQYAIGDDCECACSGTNHGLGYIAPIGERPQWVTERDAKRHQAKVDRATDRANRARRAVADAQAALVEQYPPLARLADANDGSDFMDDMVRAFESGKMTDRQAAAAARAVERHEEREHRAQAEAARRESLLASGATYPTGSVEVTGTVRSVQDRPSSYRYNGTDWKVLVEADEGFKVWMTLPRTLIDWANERRNEHLTQNPSGQDRGWSAHLVGQRVQFTAALEGSKDDPLFGYGSRPKKARVLA